MTATLTRGHFNELLQAQEFRCYYCHRRIGPGSGGRRAVRSLLLPKSYGGSAKSALNTVGACESCVGLRGNRCETWLRLTIGWLPVPEKWRRARRAALIRIVNGKVPARRDVTLKNYRPQCGKRRFDDRISALSAIAEIRHEDKTTRRGQEKNAYECPECGYWHLTSWPSSKWIPCPEWRVER